MRKAPQPGVRLQKLLSQAGITSRRKAEDLIREGKVRVNGRVVTEMGTRADPRRDRISVDGRPLRAAEPLAYLLLHKPVGTVTTLSDPEGRPTVRELLGHLPVRVYPIGRLDYTTSGLLLLTNDGELAARLMHPRYQVPREYRVKVKGAVTEERLAAFRQGIRIDAGRPAKAEVTRLQGRDDKTWLRMVLREGRTHEVRRLCEAVGLSVEKLQRVKFGPLGLGKLQAGEFRPLSPREVDSLRREVGLGRR